MLARLAVFMLVAGAAFIFDFYFDNEAQFVKSEKEEPEQEKTSQNTVYLISQVNTLTAKSSVQKSTNKRVQVKSHDKFLQKYHQLRNYQVLKAEVQIQTAPIILSYHYLVFQNYFFSDPDDVPFVS